MKSDIKAKWVDALNSGFYKQGKYQLRELGDLYDPVGVLCELAVMEGIIPAAKRYDDTNALATFRGYTYQDSATGIPKEVSEWADLPYYIAYRISILGDKGKKFDYIAAYIKENL